MSAPSQRCLGLIAAVLLAASCTEQESGPIVVSAIGEPPKLVNPNLEPIDAASGLLLGSAAQGLVRFDQSGQIEPALAQSWIVSDDGLRYTFRLARTRWSNGQPVTAEQVVERLRAAGSRASRNRLKPLLGAIAEIEAMTPDVLEITLTAPRPNFLQILAQPEMAVLRNGAGTGPFTVEPRPDGSLLLSEQDSDSEEDEAEEDDPGSEIFLRGESAAMAVARFDAGLADLVVGGTVGNLAVARAAQPDAAALRFDPVSGLFGLAFTEDPEGIWSEPEARTALAMALDRAAIVAALGVPELQPRISLLPADIEELPDPALPAWAENPLPMRRDAAAAVVERLSEGERPIVRVALPSSPGYRLLFAHLRRDWRAIGVEARRVEPGEPADLVLIDEVAPVALGSWYLRHFTCGGPYRCDEEADRLLAAARIAPTVRERQIHLRAADRLLTDAATFIAIAAPVRWSLVAPRLTEFQTNAFSRHFAGTLMLPAS